jgi:DNA-binding transcriptional MerR regulator
MADNLETPDFGNFSIQSTMEGMGSQELLSDLLGPDTSTANPDDIQDINTPDPEPAAAAPKKKAKPAASDEDIDDQEDKKVDDKKSITDFLYDPEEEDEDEDVPAAPKAAAPSDDNADDEEAVPSTQFAALSNDLFKLGVFTKDDEEEDIAISTPEEFLERFESEKKKGAIDVVNNFIGQFGEDYQEAFQAIFVNGVNPKDYFSTYNAIENFTQMDLSDEGNQVSVIKQALSDQGFDPEDITSEVERLKNYGDLESVAAKHHKVLVKKEATKLQQLEQDRATQLQQQAAIKQQYQQNVNAVLQEKIKSKEFDGIPLNPKLATELQDFLLAEKWKTPSGETLTDFDRTILDLKRPENHALKVKVGLLLKILEKDPTLSTIQKSGISKKSSELFGEVARQASKSSVKSKSSGANPTSWFA